MGLALLIVLRRAQLRTRQQNRIVNRRGRMESRVRAGDAPPFPLAFGGIRVRARVLVRDLVVALRPFGGQRRPTIRPPNFPSEPVGERPILVKFWKFIGGGKSVVLR